VWVTRRKLAATSSVAGNGITCALLCEDPLLCGARGMNMRPPVAQVTPALPVGLAAAWIGISMFLLPTGSGPLRSLPVGPVADLVTGPVVAAPEPSAHPAAAPSRAVEPRLVAFAPEATPSVSHRPVASRLGPTRTARPAHRQRPVPTHPSPPPASAPVPAPTAPEAPATAAAHGKGKALQRGHAHSPPGLAKPSETSPVPGPGRSTEEHGHSGGPPPGPPAGNGDHDHGGGAHRGGGR
jgi:hypothetical protein